VEKSLEPGEALPSDWPVDGTTGYDALAEVGNVFIDPANAWQFDELYRRLTGDQLSFAEHVAAGKEFVASTILRAEVGRLARLAPSVTGAAEALQALLVAMPVYRTYLPTGAEHLDEAVALARQRHPELTESIAELLPRLLDPIDELCVRFQQTSGAVMAKGVEDTAYYRYSRFLALNEVGGDPAAFGSDLAGFHAAQAHRQQAGRGMTTLSTHDTKRGEDVRARLAVLSELPAEWEAFVCAALAAAPIPDPVFGYLLWQTFVGAGLIEPTRMHAYAEKAMREAACRTSWIDPDPVFEATVHAAIDAAYNSDLRARIATLVDRVTPFGWSNSLSQKLVALTMPGVPDVYQGCELWEDSLVDPDNRRPVDFELRRALLDSLDAGTDAPPVDASGSAKLWVTSRALRLRRDWPELFTGYAPLFASGPAADHAIAFDRGGAITVATRLPVRLHRGGGWGETSLALGGPATDVISGRRVGAEVAIGDLLAEYPVALLVR
jgi:(1->4)-alpha-D-glucan 1-alpha-D-glucosylmutase